MSESTQTPVYIKNLLKPTATKATSRKVWSIDLEIDLDSVFHGYQLHE